MESNTSRVFIWNFYYAKAAPVQASLREAQRIVAGISGKDFRVVGFGEQMLTIAFVSDLTHGELRKKIGSTHDEQISWLLFEASGLVGGYGRKDALEWLMRRLPSERK